MINISHQQAQRLIRKALDQKLPDGQWSALETHLESCRDCRAYRDQWIFFERGLRRAIKGGWASVPGPQRDTPRRVVERRNEVLRWRRQTLSSLAGVAALVIFTLIGGFERLLNPASPEAALPLPTPTATVTPLPTPQSGEFRGVVAFDAVTQDGKRALYVFNPASHPDSVPELFLPPWTPEMGDAAGFGAGEVPVLSDDHDPAWSPDGEWLAFLSDRASFNDDSETAGKKEVFVANVAGSRMVQLTDSATIEWQGPLSWSSDGRWIALAGIRLDQGRQRWVYRVPVNEADRYGGPVAVAGSRNGFAPEFAPYGDGLAYAFSDGSQAGVVIERFESGERVSANWDQNRLAAPPQTGAGFDWAPDGGGLAYIAAQPPSATGPAGGQSAGSQVVAVRDLNYSISLFYDFMHNFQVARSRWPGAYRGVTWTPGGAVIYLEDLDDARANDKPGQTTSGCWTLQFRMLGYRGTDGRTFPISALCVESALDRSAWTPDGRWLVVMGRTTLEMAESAPRGMYAVRIPRGADDFDPYIVRLGTASGATGAPRVRPTIRRYQQPPNINPQPVNGPETSQTSPPEAQPSDLVRAGGQVYFARAQGNGSVIARMNPDGTGGRLLYASDGINRCPAPGPQGGSVAFVSDMANPPGERLGARELAGVRATPQPPVTLPPGSSPGINRRGFGPPGEPILPEQAPVPLPYPPAAPLSEGLGQIGNGNEIFLMDENGGNLVQLSALESLPESGPRPGLNLSPARYGCPSWSPDGSSLAVVVETPLQWYLGVLPVKDGQPDPDRPPRYLRIKQPAGSPGPQWMRDGRRIMLPVLSSDQTRNEMPAPRLLAVRVPSSADERLSGTELLLENNWDDISGLAVSPDGQQFGWLALRSSDYYLSGTHRSVVTLALNGQRVALSQARRALGMEYTGRPARFNQLTWLAANQIGVMLRGQPRDRIKDNIYLLDLSSNRMEASIRSEDVIYEVAWSPDGRWLMYSSESGLWAVDVRGVQAGTVRPVWLSPEPVYYLSWR